MLALSGSALPQSKPGEARPWWCQKSDIPIDARIHLGHLDNGFRFAWMPNHEPQKRCYLRLQVDVGSIGETDDERGMAHYLEHMAFNGSKHFPAGTLVEWFQKHGMGFGADTNASTSWRTTTYQIDLPTSDKAAIEEGLGVFRDFADGLLLEQKEIEKERGVIDAEERERDSPGLRVIEKVFQTQFAGTLVPERMPIGKKSVRDKFDSKSVRAFYEKWYRPEKMTLVLVGDVGDLDPEPLIRSAYADMRVPSSPPPELPAVGTPAPKSLEICIHEKDLSAVEASIENMMPWRERPENLARWKEDTVLRCARGMLDLRFSELRKKKDAPFLQAGVGNTYDTALRVQSGEELTITCTPERWKDALAFCEKELRRALEFGFEKAELDEVRADLLRSLDEAVEREKTRPSAGLVSILLDAAENPSVPNDAATERKILRPIVEALDVEACNKAFAAAWTGGKLVLSLLGNVDLGADGSKTLRAAYDASLREPVERSKEARSSEFAYASAPEKAGKVASRKHVDEFGLEEVVFENGVKLHVKKTDFKEKEIIVVASFGEGRLTLDPKEFATAWVADRVFIPCALGKHSSDDLRRLMAGKTVGVGFTIDDDEFRFSGATTREDLVRECELMRAYMIDPGWREEGLTTFQKQLPPFFDSLKKDASGPLTIQFLPELYSHDARFEFPTREKIEAVNIPAIKAWLTPQLQDAPLDVAIVGDLDVDATVQAVAQTFGALGKRRAPERYEERRKPVALRGGLKLAYEIESTIPKAFVLIAFPATDGRDTELRRRLSFLGQVLGDRLRVQVREKLGFAYSPGAGTEASDVFPGAGWIGIQTEADLGKSDAMIDACIGVADDLAQHGVTAEEFERLREPALAAQRDQLRTNGHWIHVLALLHARDHVFEDMRSFPDSLKNMKASELGPLAQKYLKRESASVAVVTPEGSAGVPKNAAAPKTDGPAPKKKE
jgi:zinc protease